MEFQALVMLTKSDEACRCQIVESEQLSGVLASKIVILQAKK